jgi:hypothetical protein
VRSVPVTVGAFFFTHGQSARTTFTADGCCVPNHSRKLQKHTARKSDSGTQRAWWWGCHRPSAVEPMQSDDFQEYDAAAKKLRSSVLIPPSFNAHPGTAGNRTAFLSSLRPAGALQRRPSSAILGPNQHASSCVKAKAAIRLTQITVPTSQDIRGTMFPSSPAPFIDSKIHVGIANMQPNIARPVSAGKGFGASGGSGGSGGSGARDDSFEAASTVKFVDICREHDAGDMNPDNMTTPFTRCSRTQLKPALPRPGYVIAPAKMKIVVDLEKAIDCARGRNQGSFNATEESIEKTKFHRVRAFLKVLKTLEQAMPKLETILSPVAAELEDFFGTFQPQKSIIHSSFSQYCPYSPPPPPLMCL